MSSIDETAYRQLRANIADACRRVTTQALLAIQLTVLQRLGYFAMMADVPEIIIRHNCKRLRIPVLSSGAMKISPS